MGSVEISRRLMTAVLRKQTRENRRIENREVAKEVYKRAGQRPPSAAAISRYLSGHRGVPVEMLPHFADYLGADLRWHAG